MKYTSKNVTEIGSVMMKIYPWGAYVIPNNFGIIRNKNGISERSMILAVELVSGSVVTPEPEIVVQKE